MSLSDLHAKDSSAYIEGVKRISSLPHTQVSGVSPEISGWLSSDRYQWSAVTKATDAQQAVVAVFHQVHQISEDIRSKMRQMGEYSEVPIEPKEQTALLDACVSQAGVIGGGVPGGQ